MSVAGVYAGERWDDHRGREREDAAGLELTIWCDGTWAIAQAGDVVWLPRGVPHAFRVGSERARVLALSVPGGHERFFRLAGEPAAALDLTAVPAGPPDLERMADAADRTGVEILGPPPFDAE
ncbi:MAG: hypothetical protein R2736_19940 [Solirubrobacterales bacterium]